MILEVRNLRKNYYKGNRAIPAVNDISFNVDEGEFISIVGRSGSGKSTFLNLIGGLDTPESGDIIFSGKNLRTMSKKELDLHRRYSVGMIFQSFNLISYRPAIDNVELPMIFSGIPPKDRKAKARNLLEEVGLGDRVDHVPSEMSGGEAQRTAIARSLANDPKMLLADEPTGNLDTSTSEDIINLLGNLNKSKGVTIVMITHEPELAKMFSDRIITLSDGKIISIDQNKKINE